MNAFLVLAMIFFIIKGFNVQGPLDLFSLGWASVVASILFHFSI